MIEIEKPRLEIIEQSEDGSYGKFVVEPLERGYGTTLGNSMRRVLLSSLPGYAPSSVKIEGVQHEFTTVKGVREDVTEIILNIKGLIVKIYGDGPKTVFIDAEGEQVVKAGDIRHDSDVEIINPELEIAHLTSEGKLHLEITLNRGRGYVSADKNKQTEEPVIGVIAVDSIFTPVIKVKYSVTPTRVGQSIDYDCLTIEVWTNKTIKALDALSLSAFEAGEIYRDELITVTAIATRHVLGGAFPSYAFMIEAEGKRLLYTGDLAADFSDYPEVLLREDFDLVVSELVHFKLESNLDTIKRTRTRRLVFTHMNLGKAEVIRGSIGEFGFDVRVADDNDVYLV